ncbi:MAG TPA: phytoene/squalene synthase family protein [Actinophytocola sp.]|nr:phytoene/squalene synthase family protein [Actinophytocola sp.]
MSPTLDLTAAYRACRRINASYGRTYFLATRLLPADRRPAVHALYGFARLADEIVDNAAAPGDPARALAGLEESLTAALRGDEPTSPVLLALTDTVRRYAIEPALFTEFLASMRMDLTVTGYRDFAELAGYVHGSAGVIGLQMLPVLGTAGPRAAAAPYAAALGEAFQLTNFLRDVGEDLDRGRLYLPADELAAFGVDRARLERAHRDGRPDPAVRRAFAHLVAYNHAVYRRAEPGIALLRRESRPCVRTAATLYRRILDEIVASDYAVLGRRVVVPTHRRLGIALPGLARAVASRAGTAARARA